METLRYYFEDGTLVIFDNYTIDTSGVIINKKGKTLSRHKVGRYNMCIVRDTFGNKRNIYIGRAIVSTFIGPPETMKHTADHIDRDPDNDTLENLRWNCKKGQRKNQDRQCTYKSAFIIVKDGIEKTSKEWEDHLTKEKNYNDRDYTSGMIKYYAQTKKHGFAYKEYTDLPDEIWKHVLGSDTSRGRWEISDMNRMKYVTKFAENVFSGNRFVIRGGYPTVSINGKLTGCHIISFETFFPDEYDSMKQDEMILHEDDNREDFRPHKLRIGTRSDNMKDAYDNGKHDGKQTARMKCASYVNGVFEKEYISQRDAMQYLKCIGIEKASSKRISEVLKAYKNGEILTRYGRTWQTI